MNTSHARAITNTCERCQSKMQAVAEMLILSCDVRPVRTENIISSQYNSPSQLKDRIFSSMKSLTLIMKTIITHVHMITTKWSEIVENLHELTAVTVSFVELCSHTAYLIAINFPDCSQALPGLVDKYCVCLAGLEIRLSCIQLKRARVEELSPQLIIDLCSNISKHIAIITDICRTAGQKVSDESTQDQFKLCVKSVTCAAGCLIASIKSYKSDATPSHHSRVLVFCEPVLASSSALVSFATEEDFIGSEARVTAEARDTHKAILGACMSIVSSCIQLCKTVRDLAFDMLTSHHRDKLRMCTDSVERASAQITELLTKHAIKDYSQSGILPDRNGKLLDQSRNVLMVEDKDLNDDCNSTSISGSENSGHSSASR